MISPLEIDGIIKMIRCFFGRLMCPHDYDKTDVVVTRRGILYLEKKRKYKCNMCGKEIYE